MYKYQDCKSTCTAFHIDRTGDAFFYFQNRIARTASVHVHWCCRQNCASTNITIKYVVNHAVDVKIRTVGMLCSEVLRPRVTEVYGS